MPIQEQAFDDVNERRLFSLELASPADLSSVIELPPRYFVCLLAWDAQGTSVDVVSTFVETLLRAGAVYFICFGQDCERVHDIIDEIASNPDAAFSGFVDSCIMTTWHAGQPLSEALSFLLQTAWPTKYYATTTHASLAISIGSPEWAREIAETLEDPRAFIS